MEVIFEILFELAFEGMIELGTNIKVPKYIRFPVLAVIILFFIGIISGMTVLGITLLKDDLFFGILMIGVAIFFLIGMVVAGYKYYRNRKSKGEKLDN